MPHVLLLAGVRRSVATTTPCPALPPPLSLGLCGAPQRPAFFLIHVCLLDGWCRCCGNCGTSPSSILSARCALAPARTRIHTCRDWNHKMLVALLHQFRRHVPRQNIVPRDTVLCHRNSRLCSQGHNQTDFPLASVPFSFFPSLPFHRVATIRSPRSALPTPMHAMATHRLMIAFARLPRPSVPCAALQLGELVRSERPFRGARRAGRSEGGRGGGPLWREEAGRSG